MNTKRTILKMTLRFYLFSNETKTEIGNRNRKQEELVNEPLHIAEHW